MISSVSNERVKLVRKLQTDRRLREQERLVVVEGDRWVQELGQAGSRPQQLYLTPTWLENESHQALLAQLNAPYDLVTPTVMAAMSNTQTAPGVLAVVAQPEWAWPAQPTLYLILDQVQNPGNLGTMLRTAAAASVEAVLLSPGCVDAYNPKTVRGGMGAQLRLPIFRCSWAEIAAAAQPLAVWVASLQEPATAYTAVNWQEPAALLIGSEAQGAGAEAMGLARGRVTIPMHAATESLNAAIAAGVILFEAQRQRHVRLTIG